MRARQVFFLPPGRGCREDVNLGHAASIEAHFLMAVFFLTRVPFIVLKAFSPVIIMNLIPERYMILRNKLQEAMVFWLPPGQKIQWINA